MGVKGTFFLLFLISTSFITQVEAFRPHQELINVKAFQQQSPASMKPSRIAIGSTYTIEEKHDAIAAIRGGGDDDEESKPLPMKIVSMIGNSIFGTIFAVSRAIGAGLDAITDEASNPVTKMLHIMSSMIQATFDANYEPKSKELASKHNFGAYLCRVYGVDTNMNMNMEQQDEEAKRSVQIRAGSFTDALVKARSQARLLVVLIPSSKPQKDPNDRKAIQSIVSSDVYEVAERKARKKEEGGSFAFWSSKFDSNEATAVIKRLKARKGSSSSGKSGKNPVLMVVYPSATMNSSGQVKIVPRVLAQHHCNPPPDAESMTKWLNALRKRHAKQYANMQHELKELELFKDRQQGFKSSLDDDRNREVEERLQEQRAAEEETARKEREEEIKERRKELLEALSEEPEKGSDGVITIALRFGDGRKGQRRFEAETLVDEVFNWIDALFKTERETIELMTMNGKKTFSFGDDDNLTLENTGLGKMAAFRVIEKEVIEADGEEETTEDDTDEESDER